MLAFPHPRMTAFCLLFTQHTCLSLLMCAIVANIEKPRMRDRKDGMDIGVCVASRVTDIDYVVHAERLGFSHA